MDIETQYKVIQALNSKVIRVKSINLKQLTKLQSLGYTIIIK